MRRMKKIAVVLCLLSLVGCTKKPAPGLPVESSSEEVTDSSEAEHLNETETGEVPVIDPFPGHEGTGETGLSKLENPRTLILGTDIHYVSEELEDGGRAFRQMIDHGDGKLPNYVREITDAFLEEVVDQHPQALILSGDLSLNGEKKGHQALAKKLEKVEEQGIPVLVIPGNHDIYCQDAAEYTKDERLPAEQTSPEDFEEIYASFGYEEAISQDLYSLSYVYELDADTRLLMLDTCQYEDGYARVGGMIKTETYEWIEEQLAEAWEEGCQVIPVGHHNLLDESQVYVEDCTIEHAEELETMLGDWGVTWFLSGHIHVQHFKTSEDSGISEVVTSSLSTAPCQYGIIEYDTDGTFDYRTRKIDVEAWAERTGQEDENLLEFRSYAAEKLQEVFFNEAYEGLKNKGINKQDKTTMAELYGRLNSFAVAGNALEIREEILEDPAYAMWQEKDGASILYRYIEEMLGDAVIDYNQFTNRK